VIKVLSVSDFTDSKTFRLVRLFQIFQIIQMPQIICQDNRELSTGKQIISFNKMILIDIKTPIITTEIKQVQEHGQRWLLSYEGKTVKMILYRRVVEKDGNLYKIFIES